MASEASVEPNTGRPGVKELDAPETAVRAKHAPVPVNALDNEPPLPGDHGSEAISTQSAVMVDPLAAVRTQVRTSQPTSSSNSLMPAD
jgi:hypothetical protein